MIKSKLEDNKIKVTVKDTGIGISSQELGNIFEPSRLVKHNSGQLHGSGMKLHISNLIAMQMGNCPMVARSTPGEGSTMIFYININTNSRILNILSRT